MCELLGIGVGSRVQGNWSGGGYWHPATVMDLLPGGAYVLQYDDGLEERAAAATEPTIAGLPNNSDSGDGSKNDGSIAENPS